MTTYDERYDAALLAHAAYLNFPAQPSGSIALTDQQLIEALVNQTDAWGDIRFTQAQAEYFVSRFSIVAFRNGADGFQAAVFRDKDSNRLTLAIRGTDEALDWANNLMVGVTTKAWTQLDEVAAFINDLKSGNQLDLIVPGETIDVVGHSLGAHLAHYVNGLQAVGIHHVTTFNGVGNGLGVGAALVFGDPAERVENIVANAGLAFVENVTGATPGAALDLFIEPQGNYVSPANHSMQSMVDSLAVYRVFEKLVGWQNFDAKKFERAISASTNQLWDTLEAALNTLARALGETPIPLSPTTQPDDVTRRDSLHELAQRIYGELPASYTRSLTFLTDYSAAQLASAAANDTAIRAALVQGETFVVSGGSYGPEYDANNFTADYLIDRARYLNSLFDRNTRDIDYAPSMNPTELFDDRTTGTILANTSAPIPGLYNLTVFGDSADETINGGDRDDRLYGGAGNDTLVGGAGRDYLDGGAGNDILRGGTGETTAAGGTGNDLYVYVKGDGPLEIRDDSGADHVSINLDTLTYDLGSSTVRQVATGATPVYQDDRGSRFVLSGTTLTVRVEDGGAITIKDFASGDFGITLDGTQPLAPPSTTFNYNVGAPNQVVNYPLAPNSDYSAMTALINQIGLYRQSFWFDSTLINMWDSPSAYFARHDTEIINVAAGIDDPENYQTANAATRGGMGDSFITGDDGVNVIYDDVEVHSVFNAVHYGQWGFPGGLGVYPVEPNLYIGIFGNNYWMADQMGNDTISAGGGNDVVYTRGGNDIVYGGAGDDYLIDTHSGAEARPNQSYTYNGVTASGVSYVYNWGSTEWINENPSHTSNDLFFGGTGNDHLYGHGGNQIMDGGADDDWMMAGAGNDTLTGGEGDGSDHLFGDVYLTQSPFDGPGIASDQTTYGNDVLDGGGGNDYLYGGGGNDVLLGGSGDDLLDGDFSQFPDLPADSPSVAGNDNIYGNAGNDTIFGGGGIDTIDGGEDDDHIWAGSGDDVVDGGSGVDEIYGDDDTGPQGNDKLHGGADADKLYGGGGVDELYGDSGQDELHGGANDDYLNGGAEQDQLYGDAGNDVLEADDGGDLLYGGANNDTYIVHKGAGYVVISDTEGSNYLKFGSAVTSADLKVSYAGGSVFIDFSPTDTVVMDAATFATLQPITFSDSLDETFSLDELRHLYIPQALADGSLQLLNGVAVGDVSYTSYNNDLVLAYGGSENTWVDTGSLSARGVAYEVKPGTYYGLSATQVLVLTNWYTASAGSYVRQLVDGASGVGDISAAAGAIDRRWFGDTTNDLVRGTGGVDQMFGREGADILDGGIGADFLSGDAGDDVLLGGADNDTYKVNLAGGRDTIIDVGGISDTLSFGSGINPTDLVLTETAAGINVQIGPVGDNNSVAILADALAPLPVERFRFADGTVWNAAAIDSHITGPRAPRLITPVPDWLAPFSQSVNFAIPAGSFVDPNSGEQLTYTATLATGEALPAWLTLDPVTGVFSANRPTSDHRVLPIRVTATDPTGLSVGDDLVLNISASQIFGTAGADTLTGTNASDVIISGDGDDNASGGQGADWIFGDAGADTLSGDAGNDFLEGGAADDILIGGAGDDVYEYRADDGADVVRETSGTADRLVFGAGIAASDLTVTETISGLRVAIAAGVGGGSVLLEAATPGGSETPSVEFFEFADGTVWNAAAIDAAITGNRAPRLATAIPGQTRGTGQPFSYIVPSGTFTDPNAGDQLTYTAVSADGSSLPAWLTFDAQTRTLSGTTPAGTTPSNVALRITATDAGGLYVATNLSIDLVPGLVQGTEGNDTLSGGSEDDAISGYGGNDVLNGGAGNDTLYGGSGNDTLDGGTGNDVLNGNDGDDTYVVDSASDVVTEAAGEGTDTVQSSVTYTLSANVENLILTGSGNVNATGNALGNVLTGNSGNNSLSGGLGDDTLDGAGGTDTLTGGDGNDVYVVGDAADVVVEVANEGVDTVNASVSFVLAAEVENLTLTGSTDLTGTGNGATNVLRGNTGNNALDGGAGSDTLIGGAGADLMIGGLGDDVYQYAVGDGADVIRETSGTSDRLVFGTGIATTDVTLNETVSGLLLTIAPSAGSGSVLLETANPGGGETPSVEFIEFAGGTVWDASAIDAHVTGNRAPRLATAIPGQTRGTGQPFSYVVPSGTFTDPNAGDQLTYTAVSADGSSLPAWLTFDAQTRTLSGTTPAGTTPSNVALRITATDAGGLYVSTNLSIDLVPGLVQGTEGNDTLSGGGEDNAIYGYGGSDVLNGGAGNDTLYGGSGNDTLDGGTGSDVLIGNDGNDTYVVDGASDVVTEAAGEGTDTVQSSVTYTLSANVENLTLAGSSNINATGNADANILLGNAGNNTLTGGAGDDTLNGGAGTDALIGGDGNDTYIWEVGSGNDTITALRDNIPTSIDTVRFGSGILPSQVTVSRQGSVGQDMKLTVKDANGTVIGSVTVLDGFNSSTGSDILDQITFVDASGVVWDRAFLQASLLVGTAGSDDLAGFNSADTMNGYAGDDRLTGNAGNDDLTGGPGNDQILGGVGDDTYHFGHGQGYDEVHDVDGVNRVVLDAGIAPADVTLYRTSGVDPVTTWPLAANADALVLVLNGSSEQLWVHDFFGAQTPRAISEIDFADGTVWNSAQIDAHTADLGGTQNTQTGTAGNDTFFVDHRSDGVNENANEGTDTISSSVSYTLPTNVENLTLTGPVAFQGTGNTLDNTIVGNALDNLLDGGAGTDTMTGGLGNDTYVVSTQRTNFFWEQSPELWSFLDTVNELAGQGTDTIVASNVYSATLSANVENLTIVGGLTGFSVSWNVTQDVRKKFTGNALDNVIDASQESGQVIGVGYTSTDGFDEGETVLDGGAGADVMIGANQLNRFIVDNAGDVVVAGTSLDTVVASVTYTMGQGVENLELSGSTAINGTGNSLNNRLDGSLNSAANVLSGGLGNDTYILGAGDTIVESAGEGNDTVVLKVPAGPVYDLSSYTNVENLTVLDAVGGGQLFGTVADNTITGNASTNLITGGAGNDLLVGGAGGDAYLGFGVGSGVDVIVDTAGSDSVVFDPAQNISISEVQFAHIGNDLRISLGGADSVTVQSYFSGTTNAIESLQVYTNDLLYTYSKAQIDARLAGTNSAPVINNSSFVPQAEAAQAFSFVVPANAFADIESQQSLTYMLKRADGTALPAWLSFDPVTRTLSGTPAGGDVGTLSLRITATDPGALTANFTFDVYIAPMTIHGTAGDDVINGDVGDDIVYADDGNDTVHGLGGNDELYGEAGNDTVYGDAGDDYVDGDVGNDQLFGGADNDYLYGGDGNDLLDGGTGDDELEGSTGDDTYVIDSINDVIYENPGEGTDTVQSSITYTLAADLENLTLIGSGAINGTGNAVDNVLTGNSGSNTLAGGSGNDTLDPGSAGTDVLRGGLGNDTYIVARTSGITITENAGEGTDTVNASVTLTLGSNVENLVLTGTSAINGTGNTLANVITGNSGNNTLNGGTGADTLIGGAGNDTYTVDNTGDVVTEVAGGGTDLVNASVTYTITGDVENLTLTGTSAINGTGNVLDNVLTGNSGNNTLVGGGGNDTLNPGSAGTDVLQGGIGNDTYVVTRSTGITITENAGEGTDTVSASVAFTLGSNVENLTLTGTSAINGTGNTLDNVLIGNSGSNTLVGLGGNDTLDAGSAGTDILRGGTGDDVYIVSRTSGVTYTENASEGTDRMVASVTTTLAANIEILFLTGSTAINGTGLSAANFLRGNSAINTLSGAGGTDILEGGLGNDILSNTSGNTLLNGGGDNDTLTGTANNDMLIGGTGNDTITTGQGADIIMFDKGDGQDAVAVSTMKDNTLTLGGGFLYADLLFQKSGNDLILKAGATDQITFTGYYASTSNRSVDKMQFVIEGTSEYDSGSSDALHNKKIITFNFDGLVSAFDAARAANPSLTTWALTNATVAQYLSGSDTAAIGGDLAYRYGRFDTLSDISYTPAQALLAAAGFGTSTQTLQTLASLQDTTPRLG